MRKLIQVVVITTLIVVVMRVDLVVFLIDRGADQSVLMPRRPRVHVDLESRSGYLMAHRIFYAHSQGMSILKRRLGVAGNMHHGH